jgi:hypothetical protein
MQNARTPALFDPFLLSTPAIAYVDAGTRYTLRDLRCLVAYAPTPKLSLHSATINTRHAQDRANPRLGLAQMQDAGFYAPSKMTLHRR